MYRFETCSHIIYYNDGRSISYAWYKSASVYYAFTRDLWF